MIKYLYWIGMSHMLKHLIIKTLIQFDFLKERIFHGANMENISLQVPYVSSSPGNCGGACVVMVIKSHGVKIESSDDFITGLRNENNYIENVGWTHKGLAEIAADYGVSIRSYRYKSAEFVIRQLQNEKPVIVSLQVPDYDNVSQKELYAKKDQSEPLSYHLCVAVGMEMVDDQPCVILHDPRNIGIYTKNVEVPLGLFRKIFTGNCLV